MTFLLLLLEESLRSVMIYDDLQVDLCPTLIDSTAACASSTLTYFRSNNLSHESWVHLRISHNRSQRLLLCGAPCFMNRDVNVLNYDNFSLTSSMLRANALVWLLSKIVLHQRTIYCWIKLPMTVHRVSPSRICKLSFMPRSSL